MSSTDDKFLQKLRIKLDLTQRSIYNLSRYLKRGQVNEKEVIHV
jgi:hypothetical protein